MTSVTNVQTAGRTDLEAFFSGSGYFGSSKMRWTRYPLLAFVCGDDAVQVRIIDRLADALSLDDATPCMMQWAGQWRSDFFQFTIADLRAAVKP